VPAFGGLDERPRVEIVRSPDNLPVDAIVLVPQFSEARQQWFVDVELTGLTYWPFLSLALARYQDHALDGLRMSEVVRAELVQLAPDRTASVVRQAARRVRVIVRGVSAGNLHEAQHTGAPGGAHRMRVRIEVPKTTANTELDWRTTASAVLSATWANADEVEWAGTLQVPAHDNWRVMVEESEVFAGDERGGTGVATAERITYLETLDPP
jgi:hypothetical protein